METLIVDAAQRSQKRLKQWKYFEDQGYNVNSGHTAAQCIGCYEEEGISAIVGGTKEAMDGHLCTCKTVSKEVQQEAQANVARCKEAAAAKKLGAGSKRKRSDISCSSSSSTCSHCGASAGGQQTLTGLVPLKDKPLGTADKQKFEQLVLSAVLSANMPLQTVDNPPKVLASSLCPM